MKVNYTIKHNHSRYIVYKNDIEIGFANTKVDAQKLIEEDKAKRSQYAVTWVSKSDPSELKFNEVEAKDDIQARIKIQQLNMNNLEKILRVERI